MERIILWRSAFMPLTSLQLSCLITEVNYNLLSDAIYLTHNRWLCCTSDDGGTDHCSACLPTRPIESFVCLTRVAPLPSSYVVSPSLATQLLGSGVTEVLPSVGHQGATFSCTTKLPSCVLTCVDAFSRWRCGPCSVCFTGYSWIRWRGLSVVGAYISHGLPECEVRSRNRPQ